MMRLYKYRSLQRLDYVLDILLNKRLHCAPYKDLNDPFEGMFSSEIEIPLEKMNAFPSWGVFTFSNKFTSYKDISFYGSNDAALLKVCSLSCKLSDVRLWSHYADSHRGIVIQIDFDDDELIRPITYQDTLPSCTPNLLFDAIAPELLTIKTTHWEHEGEFRIITKNNFHPIKGNISAIYCGIKSTEDQIKLLRKVTPENIPIFKCKLDKEKILILKDNTHLIA